MVQLQRFAARPIVLDAIQITHENIKEVHAFLASKENFSLGLDYVRTAEGFESIQSPNGMFRARIGDWIVWEQRFNRYDTYTDAQMQREYVPTSNLTLNQYFGESVSVAEDTNE